MNKDDGIDIPQWMGRSSQGLNPTQRTTTMNSCEWRNRLPGKSTPVDYPALND